MSLRTILTANRLSIGHAAKVFGVDKSTVSKICSQTYPNWEQKEKEFIDLLNEKGYSKTIPDELSVDTDVVIPTRSVNAFVSLADDLADPEGSRCSSLGMVIGTAERGKTHTARWYAETHDDASYVLFIEGSTRVQLLRDICEALANVRPITFGACLDIIHESCSDRQRLIIIDEADKLPVAFLELLRGINERCKVPILLAGEEALKSKVDRIPRLRSRGAWRSLVNDALALARMGRASGITTVTPQMIEKLK